MQLFKKLSLDLSNTNYIKGLLLLIIAISGNYIGETLGCGMIKLLTEHMLFKQLIVLLMIYFTISFTGNVGENPIHMMKQTIILWVFFLMFTKTNVYINMLIFCIIATLYIMETFIDYHSTKKNKRIVENLKLWKGKLILIVCCITVVGFYLYYKKQRKDHLTFSMQKFLFGIPKCDSV